MQIKHPRRVLFLSTAMAIVAAVLITIAGPARADDKSATALTR